MILTDGLILYHGSYLEINDIDLDMCDEKKDFGKGFYLTRSKEQAASFIKTSLIKAKQKGIISQDQSYGYVTAFKVNLSCSISSFEFDGADRAWLYYIAINRRGILRDKLKKMLDDNFDAYEVIAGKIANDDTNATLNAFLAGTFGPVDDNSSFEIVSRLLKPDRLENQYCFKSEASIRMLEKIGVERYEI